MIGPKQHLRRHYERNIPHEEHTVVVVGQQQTPALNIPNAALQWQISNETLICDSKIEPSKDEK